MTESTRTSALADRHRALGSDLGDWNGMGVAWSYATDPCDEHDAVRTAAGLFDVSGLKKVHVRGPDSTAVVDQGKNVDIEFDDNLHDISLQGPKAVEFLNTHTPMDLPSLKYFHHQDTELFGHPCTISRTGYSGERGYEIFANPDWTVGRTAGS